MTSIARALAGSASLLLIAAQDPAEEARKVDFVRDIQPILREACYECHGPDKQKGHLRLDSKDSAFKGGVSGTAIQPGKSDESLLVRLLLEPDKDERMPRRTAPLPPDKIRLIRAWIDQGATWPQTASVPVTSLQTHWAYVRPARPEPPAVRDSAWCTNPIDRFIAARLEKEKLAPSPEASKETLLRRASLDLAGLPPTPEEMDAFLVDPAPDAYEKAVERLLASPHFGERWARLWLDLARYAESNGHLRDRRRTMWRYRDWVIRALNADMPFRQFTIEQMAGDMLPGATTEQLVATGFHRNASYNEELADAEPEEGRWEMTVDRVSTTATVWLGTTIACAQCHNHKFDPFSQKEYYRLFAFFEGVEWAPSLGHDTQMEPAIELATPEQKAERERLKAEIARLQAAKAPKEEIKPLQKQLAALDIPRLLVLKERKTEEPPFTHFRIRGGFLNRGEKVTAGTPVALHPIPAGERPDRLALARWLVADENPLTARVTVNRLWEQYFGRGLVETSEDFGTQGSRPSHPDLLDWLAAEFVRQGWSLKAVHRLIATSATYRQSSRVNRAMLERDPYNVLLARGPRFRMEAEMIRDAALVASGQLSRRVGGPSVYPPQPEGIWAMIANDDGVKWATSAGEDRFRRGLYTFWRRTAPYPTFMTFDAPSREACTVRRIRTNTPLQALTTLNDPAFFDAARALALRVLNEGAESRVTFAYRLVVSRSPAPREAARVLSCLGEEIAHFRKDLEAARRVVGKGSPVADADLPEAAAWTMVANVLLNLDEAITKE